MKKEDKKRLTKELLKEWQRTHYQEYCDFSDMMHDRNGVGFDKVYAEAVMMIPKFEKALFLYLKNDRSENIDDLENLLKNEGIISKLSLHFFAQLPDSYTPAMLCWLFFGRSFECMVEYGEEMISNPKLNFLLRRLARVNIKAIISRSIAIKARTEEDWVKFVEELDEIGETPTVTASVVSKFKSLPTDTKVTMKATSEKTPIPGKQKKRRSLEELLPNGDEYLFESIDEHVSLRQSGRDLALLYLVLDKGRAMVRTTVTEFHAALVSRYEDKANVEIPGHRWIQGALKDYLEPTEYKQKTIQTFERPEHIMDYNDLRERLNVADYMYSY